MYNLFGDDDKKAMSILYGPKTTPSYIPPTTPVPHNKNHMSKTSTIKHRTSLPTTTTTPALQNILCLIPYPDFMFLATSPQFPNYRMYVGYGPYIWKFDLNEMRLPKHPELITDYLPKELRSAHVSHVFQNSEGHLVTIRNNQYYAASFPNLKIQKRFMFPSIPARTKINALFQTNSGQTYLLYNDDSYIEFNEAGDVLNRGPMNYLLPGLPDTITSAFRYTDGFIYFFQNNTYYKYSEYTRYKNLDRHVGFDLATSKLILKDLATFHAVPLAIRLLEPEEFTRLFKNMSMSLPPKPKDKKPPSIFKIMVDTLSANDKYKTVADKLMKMLADFTKLMEEAPEKMFNNQSMRTFSTIIHQDMWINNTMQVIENDVAVKNKFVDFQMSQVGSPADDIIFFLFSSVEYDCLKNNLDSLIKYYYEEVICILKKLDLYNDCFSYENLLEEFKTTGKLAIVRALFMLPKVIFGEKGKADHENLDEMTVEDIHPIALKKMILLCVEAAERDWL
ncbi:unnamed protein product [Diabrotica balteata]|uniref:CHK kinase-like domain-containing protein n=1 Tax=Diabrotica balteata TaxID=107213 RepID=A0A9N9SZR0_DIABA|nr:unnamed protein product [Diabrotica balteata]